MYSPESNAGVPGAEMAPFMPTVEVAPEPEAPVVNPDVLAFPDIGDHTVGESWDQELGDGVTLHYTIPEGNGLNTVDVTIEANGVVVGTARVARAETGPGYRWWNTGVGGHSSYFETGDPAQGGYGQTFLTGASTAGAPSSQFTVGPNWSWVATPSYDTNGNPIGVDIGVRNGQGLYDNEHQDLHGFTTLTQTGRDAHGGLTSVFAGQLDNTGRGWILDANGRPAEHFLDGNNNPVIISTDPITGKKIVEFAGGRNTFDSDDNWIGHVKFGVNGEVISGWEKDAWYSTQLTEYRRDWLSRLREEIIDPITGLRGEVRRLGDRTKITYTDGTEILLDRHGNPINTRSLAEKATAAVLNFGRGGLRNAAGMLEGLTAIAGLNDAINIGGGLLGFKPNLITQGEAQEGLLLGIGGMLLADTTAAVGTLWGGYKSLTGQQSWGKTWSDAWHAALNSYNERSKFFLGTDWTGFADHPAETLGSATVGVGAFFIPIKGPRIRGKGTPGAPGTSKPAPTKPTPKTQGPAANTKPSLATAKPNLARQAKAANSIVDQAPSIPREAYQRPEFGAPLREILRTEADINQSAANAIIELEQQLQFEARVPRTERSRVNAHASAHGSTPARRSPSGHQSPSGGTSGSARNSSSGAVPPAGPRSGPNPTGTGTPGGGGGTRGGNPNPGLSRHQQLKDKSLNKKENVEPPTPVPTRNAQGHYEVQMARVDHWAKNSFRRKAVIMERASSKNPLTRKPDSVQARSGAAQRSIRREYKRLIRREYRAKIDELNRLLARKVINQTQYDWLRAKADYIRRRRLDRLRTREMDHLVELQLEGLDARVNLAALEDITNHGIGQQIRNQLIHIPDGAPVIIKVVKW